MKLRFILATAVVTALLASCQGERYESTLELAVNDTVMNIDAGEGTTHVLVYAKGAWSASVSGDDNWLVLDRSGGTGHGEFILSWTSNTGLTRRGIITLTAKGVGHPVTITVTQAGAAGTPDIRFTEAAQTFIAWPDAGSVPYVSNVPSDLLTVSAEADWITDLGIGAESVSFSLSENLSGAERTANLTLQYEDVYGDVFKSTARITQTAEPGYIRFAETEIDIDSFEADKVAAVALNVGSYLAAVQADVTYEGGATGWLDVVSFDADALRFHVAANTDKENARTAVVTLRLSEREVSSSLTVVQSEFQQRYSLAELKALLPAAGSMTLTGDYFEATALSDGGAGNLAPALVRGYADLDPEESLRTNYVYDADGGGLRLKMRTGTDNVLQEGHLYKISLKGATLVREDNPVRYTLTGLTANNFGDDGEQAMTPTVRTVASLSEADLFTLVTLRDVEIALDYGSYANLATAWVSPLKQNTATRLLRDKDGNTLQMMVNPNAIRFVGTSAEDARDVPHGSGTVTGIVVHDTNADIPFYQDFMLGNLQIRPRTVEDIRLGMEEEDGFSRHLEVWYYPHGNNNVPGGFAGKIDAANPNRMWSQTGTAYLEKPSTATNYGQSPSQMNLWEPSPYAEGDARALRCNSNKNDPWWNTKTDTGLGFRLHLSTSSVTGSGRHPVLVFSMGGGQQTVTAASQTPVWWKVSYQVDGGDEKDIETVFIRPLPSSGSYQLNTLPLELTEVCVPLPDEILGHDDVDIRITAAGPESINWSTGAFTATAGQDVAQYMRFGAIAIKYNK